METKNRAKRRENIVQSQLQMNTNVALLAQIHEYYLSMLCSQFVLLPPQISIIKFNTELEIIGTVAIQTRLFILSFVLFLSVIQ